MEKNNNLQNLDLRLVSVGRESQQDEIETEERGEKNTRRRMDSVTQSIHSKCQCVIDCTSLVLQCCFPADQYYHYPNYAVCYLSAPVK